MPLYEFHCAQEHAFETLLSARDADKVLPCPTCGADASRVASAPNLRLVDPGRRRLVESTQATSESPSVVTQLPASGKRRRTPVTRNPLHAKLPRP